MRIYRRNRAAKQFTEQDVSQGLGDRSGTPLQQVGHAHVNAVPGQPNEAIGVSERTEIDANHRRRGSPLQDTEDAAVHLRWRLEEQTSLHLGHPRGSVRKVKITALGCYVPPRVLTNDDLEKMVETNNQWILERTGISERHIAGPEAATSDLAVEAARQALEQRGIDAADIDAILVCTVTPDMFFPSTACLVQHQIGATRAWGFDLVAACSGFVYGLTTAAHLVGAGTHNKVLVIGSDTMSRIIDYTDRSTCVLFGDGAGAMLVEPLAEDDDQRLGFIDFIGQIDGSGGNYLKMSAGGSRMPATVQTLTGMVAYLPP